MMRITRYLLSIAIAMLLAGCGGSQPPIAAPVALDNSALHHHRTFHYTGRKKLFTVPAGVNAITVDALGAAGDGEAGSRGGNPYQYFGLGGRVYAVIPVTPGEILYVFVGGPGSDTGVNGFNGGARGGRFRCFYGTCFGFGGGGASDVRAGGDSLEDRILVAGGGGGAGPGGFYGSYTFGGAGGGRVGGDGGSFYPGQNGYGGTGGRQHNGGLGGAGGSDLSYGDGGAGKDGSLGNGGKGGKGGYPSGSFGYIEGTPGGGGGGGYYGGGGGGGAAGDGVSSYGYQGGGGGGGSSYVESTATKVKFWRGWFAATGKGLVVFSW